MIRMKRALFLILLTISVDAHSQLNNTAFEQRGVVNEADSGNLFLGINLLGFGKNNEYFDTTVEGYTLFGYQINPYLSYNISKNVLLDAGVYAQKDFGNDRYSEVKPTLSLKVVNRNYSFIFGTLEGSIHHRLIEPLYDFERGLNNRLENGIQFLWMREGLFLDAWVDWQKMIYLNDAEPERFTGGISFNKTLFRSGGFHVDLPIQGLAAHQGGQIDVAGNPVVTRYNGAVGLSLELESSGFISAWGLKSYAVGSNTSSEAFAYQDGNGIFLNPYITTKIGLTVMGSYWHGNEFHTIQGNQLYPSITENYPSRFDEERTFIMLRFLYDKKLADGLTLTARAEPFYDTYAQAIEYSFGIYLCFTDRFFLVNAKKSR